MALDLPQKGNDVPRMQQRIENPDWAMHAPEAGREASQKSATVDHEETTLCCTRHSD